MKFEHTKVFNFEGAFRGMRNPLKSWDKSDSFVDDTGEYVIGNNDMDLAQRLIKAGNPNDKFLRQIMVSVDITAPRYFWQEFDTYKVGTVENSESTMHTGGKNLYTMEDFEVNEHDISYEIIIQHILPYINQLVQTYNQDKNYECVKQIKKLLPESFLQRRTVTLNYEIIRNMLRQRYNHRLPEWRVDFVNWCKTLPYAEQLLFYENCDGKFSKDKVCKYCDTENGWCMVKTYWSRDNSEIYDCEGTNTNCKEYKEKQ